ncbi:hypothetical protein [Leisingera sp. JC1]|uniref:hypothetical protein n=1 Tax=Leisingera sp. JC1 TaxID=1855282 RepID=UPI000802A3C9|nr:hypothetical protein [Leisingera sp. JC1]OBY26761.1 hypothetical protein A9D60_17375 [Leisingera sp. JC1]
MFQDFWVVLDQARVAAPYIGYAWFFCGVAIFCMAAALRNMRLGDFGLANMLTAPFAYFCFDIFRAGLLAVAAADVSVVIQEAPMLQYGYPFIFITLIAVGVLVGVNPLQIVRAGFSLPSRTLPGGGREHECEFKPVGGKGSMRCAGFATLGWPRFKNDLPIVRATDRLERCSCGAERWTPGFYLAPELEMDTDQSGWPLNHRGERLPANKAERVFEARA